DRLSYQKTIICSTALLQSFEDAGRSLAASHAHRDHSVAGATSLHFAKDRRCELGAGASQRMPQRDRAAVDVDALHVQARLANHRERLDPKSFVELDDADVVQLQARH